MKEITHTTPGRRGRRLIGLGVLGALLFVGPAYAADAPKAGDVKPDAVEKQDAAQPAAKAADGKTSTTYPLETCVVSGEKLGSIGKPYRHQANGRTVMFCCKGCVKDFDKEPAKYLGKLDAAVIKRQKGAYPLETCVVSDAKLGEMGKPLDYVSKDNRLVRFCCKGCVKKFEAEPAKYYVKIDEAAKARDGAKGNKAAPDPMEDMSEAKPAADAHAGHGDAGHEHQH